MSTISNREPASSVRSKLNEILTGDVIKAIAALASTGIIVRTGDGTASVRTITGTANEITVTNGSGVSGNPTLSLPSSITLSGKTVTGGTFVSVTFTSPVLTTPQINDTSSDHQYVFAVNELVADRTVTLPLLGSNDEFVFKDHAVTLANKTLASPVLTTPQINDTSSDHQYVFAVSELAADRTITLPLLGGNDVFVFADFTQTLTNKTFNLANNTLAGAKSEFNTACTDGNFVFEEDAYTGKLTIVTTAISASNPNSINESAVVFSAGGGLTFTIANDATNPLVAIGKRVIAHNTHGADSITIATGGGVTLSAASTTIGPTLSATFVKYANNSWFRVS